MKKQSEHHDIPSASFFSKVTVIHSFPYAVHTLRLFVLFFILHRPIPPEDCTAKPYRIISGKKFNGNKACRERVLPLLHGYDSRKLQVGINITRRNKEKDEILEEFAKNGKILLATTVIEVGISLPRLSTIVIVGAERLGLATLHQLRGRVGRVGLKSYCYLYTKLKELPQRLLDFSKTLDGFKIAELDLKNRLSGDLLDGSFQHGNEFKFFDFASDEEILKQAKQKLG